LIEVLVVSKAGKKFHKSAQRQSFEQEFTEIPKKVDLVQTWDQLAVSFEGCENRAMNPNPLFEIFAISWLKKLS
jgi:hypothetical protein